MTTIIEIIGKIINVCGLALMILTLLVFHGEDKDFLLIKAGEIKIKIKAFDNGDLVPYFKRIARRE